jgi:hypothetical protein
MNFLAPLFLLGGLALAAPVVFHLIKRTTRERAVFSSLMFLLPTPPRLSKRSRLEDILLLLLRCLALALLALGFSRPFFKETPLADPSAAAPKRIVVLVDISASMRREGVWAAARERAETALRRATPVDEVSLLTFDRQAVTLLSFDEWNRSPASDRVALATGRLAAVSPGWGATRLGNALISAAEALAENNDKKRAPGPRQVVLVSDLQAGSRLDALQAYEWPKGVQLFVEPVKARTVTNAGLQLIADASDAPRTADAVVRVRVTNSTEAKREQFQLGWSAPVGSATAAPAGSPSFVGATVDVYVPPGQSRVAVVPVPKVATGLDRIVLRGDEDDFDNTVYLLPPEPQRFSMLWLGADTADDPKQPLFFLNRAFVESPKLSVRVVARGPSAPLLPDEVSSASVIFVGDDLPAGQSAALREQLLAGKTAVVVAKSVAVAPTIAALLGREGVTLTEMRVANYAMLAEIDFRHPLFAPFADPKFSDFTKISFWKYRKLDVSAVPEARAVAKFDNGDPALVEVPVGKGRLLVLASGWQPDDSLLARSTKFVPLLYSLLELGGASLGEAPQYFVGDALPAAAGGTVATKPGIVDFNEGGRAKRLAVNLDANESRTAPLSPDELERLGVPVAQPAPVARSATKETILLQAAEAENRQKLWRWFIVAALVVLLIESALAGWTARRLTLKTEEAVP